MNPELYADMRAKHFAGWLPWELEQTFGHDATRDYLARQASERTGTTGAEILQRHGMNAKQSPPEPPPKVEPGLLAGLRNGKWLDEQEFPPLAYALPGVIPEGSVLLVGPLELPRLRGHLNA